MRNKGAILAVLLIGVLLMIISSARAGVYLNSAHGNSSYGVQRSAAGPAGYPQGHCAHCHEQHASMGGSEPSPTGGPSDYSLFSTNYVSQSSGVCYNCHIDAGSYQTGGSIFNRSYSYRAGGWTADTVNDVQESFSYTSPDSRHGLDDILTFITGRWGFTADSNPCVACHNPHAVQGDPANSPSTAKTSGTRGYAVSRPSQHSSDSSVWGVWGDGAGEKMSDYAGTYQAPYRFSSTTLYEPDGSTTTDGSNLADFATFCTDCHNNSNIINSTALGRNLYTFNWSNEKHGGGAASDACADIILPYQSGTCGTYALACTDCHEPHGSPNVYLIRKVVNSAVVTIDTLTSTAVGPDGKDNKEWVYLCQKCHDGLISPDGKHPHPDFVPPDVSGCSACACHDCAADYRPCGECHFHGNNLIDGVSYGEQLF